MRFEGGEKKSRNRCLKLSLGRSSKAGLPRRDRGAGERVREDGKKGRMHPIEFKNLRFHARCDPPVGVIEPGGLSLAVA